MNKCTMIFTSREDGGQTECASEAKYVYIKDPQHFCCKSCYDDMDDDIQAEYKLIALRHMEGCCE